MEDTHKQYKIKVMTDGPYIVTGGVPLSEKIIASNGRIHVFQQGRTFPASDRYALCRCGKSNNNPFCDGAHVKTGFDGSETASRETYEERANLMEGPELNILDDSRCSYSRFCHRNNKNIWELAENSDLPGYKEEAIEAAFGCPSGRLMALDKEGNPLEEPNYEPSIDIIQDPEEGVSSGLFVKGNIPIEAADGTLYEIRNRVMLCRCGNSSNKPFCDASHDPDDSSDTDL